VELPPLRFRPTDLPLLAQQFLEDRNRTAERPVAGFMEPVWPLLTAYQWPLNLDELRTTVEAAAAACETSYITPEDLPYRFRAVLAAQSTVPSPNPAPIPLDEILERTERQAILLSLERCGFNKSRAAELLGINRPRLYRRMEQLGIEDREGAAANGPGSHDVGSHVPGSHVPGSHDAGSHDAGSHDAGSHEPGAHDPGSGFPSKPPDPT
jgi:DNA-binding NtrC family response regulator